VDTIPCRAITSDRVWGTHPSARSPRTALQAGADGNSLHIWTGGESAYAPLAARHTQAVKGNAQDKKFRMSANSFFLDFQDHAYESFVGYIRSEHLEEQDLDAVVVG
jgi:hypothetical protein